MNSKKPKQNDPSRQQSNFTDIFLNDTKNNMTMPIVSGASSGLN